MSDGVNERASGLRDLLRRGRAPLLARVTRATSQPIGRVLGAEHASLLDDLLRRAFDEARAEVGASADGVALAGVGGYGRGAVALGADLDLRILTRDLGRAESIAEALLYPLWDAGVTVGHQVVTIEDLLAAARDDLPTATSLLDWRFVAGDRALSDDLLTRARAGIFSISELPTFFGRLDAAVDARHKRYGGSVYMLEPDVKNGPGALRDVDVSWWAARARWHVGEFTELVRLGVLVPRQLNAVEEARDVLWRIRNALHGRAGRRSDRLSFDEQEAIAPVLGYLEGTTGHREGASGHREGTAAADAALREAVERMMSDFYRAARTVSRFRDLLCARAMPVLKRRRPSRHDIADGVQLFDGEATLTDLELLRSDPSVALRVVQAAVKNGVPIRASARNAIIDVCGDVAWTERLRAEEGAATLFIELLTNCRVTRLKRKTVMRELHDLGLLVAMIPEFAPVVGRVHHDTYHVYTVDVHSVAAVDRLGEIIRGDIILDEDEGDRWVGSLACRVASELTRTRVLFFATLLHDVGKAIGRRDHSERGAEMARTILARLGLSATEIDKVCRLILHHLTMYLTATRRDLDDPATAEELAEVAVDPEGLRNLYLLTVADLSTTSPTSMTSWKARMLDELFIATLRHFREGLRSGRAADVRVQEMLAGIDDHEERAHLEAFLRMMPMRYCSSNVPEDVAAHAEVLRRYESSGRHATVACVGAEDPPGVVQLCVVAQDRHGLLANIAAVLTASRLIVHAAQIYSGGIEDGDRSLVAVDLFWVERAGGGSVTPLLARLEADLDDVLSGRRAPDGLAQPTRRARRRDREGPHVATKVIVDNRASPKHSVVEVFTRDRPGLLFQLASVIAEQGLSITIAKLATEGTRVVDVFYVADDNGNKLDGERAEALREAMHERLTATDRSDPPREAAPG